MAKRLIILAGVLAIVLLPARAVLKERDLNQTISVLRAELENSYREQKAQMARYHKRAQLQHQTMIDIMQRSDQISLMLYSQKDDYTFDLTYACHEATELYKEFQRHRQPYRQILGRVETEIVRYTSLLESLKSLPPVADAATADSTAALNSVREEISKENKAAHQGRSPFLLDATSRKYRDDCIRMATEMLQNLQDVKAGLSADQSNYAEIEKKLKKVSDYAERRYAEIQNSIFINGGDSYFTVLKRLSWSIDEATNDTKEKYRVEEIAAPDGQKIKVSSQWRGPGVILFAFFIVFYLIIAAALSGAIMKWLVPRRFRTPEFMKKKVCIMLVAAIIIFALAMSVVRLSMGQNNFTLMASGLLIEYAWLVGVILLSLLFRLKGEQIKSGFRIYTPVMCMGFVIIAFRVIFIPNNLVNLIFPPMVALFTVWQWLAIRRHNMNIPKSDIFYTWISLVIMIASTVAAWMGYTLMAVQILIWWMFQLTCIQTITSFFHMLGLYEAKYLVKRIPGLLTAPRKNRKQATNTADDLSRAIQKIKDNKGDYINKTWFFDLIYMALVPVLGVMSVMWSIWWAADVFNLSNSVVSFFLVDFIKIPDVLYLSIQKIVLACSLWFVFRYVGYLLKALYRKYHKQDNTVGARPNITLANNVIAILVWGAYFIICMLMLHIPGGAISIISAGLATGIGFAMKDLLENFFYGISLMTGRIRVGDFIECDGIRGKVESITYQSTQIATLDGSIIAFLNNALFSKNFKNLTKNHNYELVRVPVGVAYGSDIDKVRKVLIEAVAAINGKTRDGRNLISTKRQMDVYFEDFGDSSVNLFFACWMLVEERFTTISRVKEAIYNALNANNITIPFPQRDLHIVDN